MNLISKEETINVLAARAEETGGIGRSYYERAMQIVAAIPDTEVKQEAAAEWTPANKNPKKKGPYLCFLKNSNGGSWQEVCEYRGKGQWASLDELDASIVVKFWRPLPENP